MDVLKNWRPGVFIEYCTLGSAAKHSYIKLNSTEMTLVEDVMGYEFCPLCGLRCTCWNETTTQNPKHKRHIEEMLSANTKHIYNYDTFKKQLDDCLDDSNTATSIAYDPVIVDRRHFIVSVWLVISLIIHNSHFIPKRDEIIKRWFCKYYS